MGIGRDIPFGAIDPRAPAVEGHVGVLGTKALARVEQRLGTGSTPPGAVASVMLGIVTAIWILLNWCCRPKNSCAPNRPMQKSDAGFEVEHVFRLSDHDGGIGGLGVDAARTITGECAGHIDQRLVEQVVIDRHRPGRFRNSC